MIGQLQKRFGEQVHLEPVLWEDLPIGAEASFQETIDLILSNKGVDIAVFILWSRLGSEVAGIRRPDGGNYRSGTEREFDLMLAARKASEAVPSRPDILVYTRSDDEGFAARLAEKSSASGELEQLVRQKQMAEQFIREHFHDEEGRNLRAYHSFPKPVDFASRLKVHLTNLLDERLESRVGKATWEGNPYVGLRAFQADQAAVFFGRERETDELAALLRARERDREDGCAFACVVGASGSGKSSLVRAGLASELMEDWDDDGVPDWCFVAVTPSELVPDPARMFVEVLGQTFPALMDHAEVEDLASALRDNPDLFFKLSLLPVIRGGADQSGGRTKTLLLVDQFEEFLTLSHFRSTEDFAQVVLPFLEVLARSGRFWVVATLRSDYYPAAQQVPQFLGLRGPRNFDLVPPDSVALRRIVTRPAALAGLGFEVRDGKSGETLADHLLSEVEHQPDALPLLQFALEELYEVGAGEGVLSFPAYEQVGGIAGAIQIRAEKTYDSLKQREDEPSVEATFVHVFSKLFTIDLASGKETAVRRPAREAEVLGDAPDRQAAGGMLEAFIEARLLTTYLKDGERFYSVAHEALLHGWPRLVALREREAENLRRRSRLEPAERAYAGTPHPSNFLAEGLPLNEARTILAESPHLLTPQLKGFIDKSAAHHAGRRLRKRVIVTMTLVLFGGLAVVAGWLGVRAERQRELAETANVVAKRNEAEALESFGKLVREKARVAGLAGDWETVRAATLDAAERAAGEVEDPLINTLGAAAVDWTDPTRRLALAGHFGTVHGGVFSPDGRWLFSTAEDNQIKKWDAVTGDFLGAIHAHDGKIAAMELVQPGAERWLLASAGSDRRVVVSDPATMEVVYESVAESSVLEALAVVPGRSLLVTGSGDRKVVLHDWEQGKVVKEHVGNASLGVLHLEVLSGGKILIVFAEGSFEVWDWEGEGVVWSERTELGERNIQRFLREVEVSSDGRYFALVWNDQVVQVYDLEAEGLLTEISASPSPIVEAGFQRETPHPEVAARYWLVIAHVDGTVARWNAVTGQSDEDFLWVNPLRLGEQVTAACFPVGTDRLCLGLDSGRVLLAHRSTGQVLCQASMLESAVELAGLSAATGVYLFGGRGDGALHLWRPPLNEVDAGPLVGGISDAAQDAVSGRYLVGSYGGIATIMDPASPGVEPAVLEHGVEGSFLYAVGWSPDGSRVLTAGGGSVKVWDAEDGGLLDTLSVSDPALAPELEDEAMAYFAAAQFVDNNHLLVAIRQERRSSSGQLRFGASGSGWYLVDLQKKERLEGANFWYVSDLRVSPDRLKALVKRHSNGMGADSWTMVSLQNGQNWNSCPEATAAGWINANAYLVGTSEGELRRIVINDDQWVTEATGKPVNVLKVYPEQNRALVGWSGGRSAVVNLENGEQIAEFQDEIRLFADLHLTADTVVLVSQRGLIVAHDLETGQVIRRSGAGRIQVSRTFFDGNTVTLCDWTGGMARQVIRHEGGGWRERGAAAEPVGTGASEAVGAGGELAELVGAILQPGLVRRPGAEERKAGAGGQPPRLGVFAPQMRTSEELARLSYLRQDPSRLVLVDLQSGQLRNTVPLERLRFRHEWNEDFSRALISGIDGSLLHLDLGSGQVKPIMAHERRILRLLRMADNRQVVTTSYDTTAKLWDLQTGALIHTIQAPSGHTFAGIDPLLDPLEPEHALLGASKGVFLVDLTARQGEVLLALTELKGQDCEWWTSARFTASGEGILLAHVGDQAGNWLVEVDRSGTIVRELDLATTVESGDEAPQVRKIVPLDAEGTLAVQTVEGSEKRLWRLVPAGDGWEVTHRIQINHPEGFSPELLAIEQHGGLVLATSTGEVSVLRSEDLSLAARLYPDPPAEDREPLQGDPSVMLSEGGAHLWVGQGDGTIYEFDVAEILSAESPLQRNYRSSDWALVEEGILLERGLATEVIHDLAPGREFAFAGPSTEFRAVAYWREAGLLQLQGLMKDTDDKEGGLQMTDVFAGDGDMDLRPSAWQFARVWSAPDGSGKLFLGYDVEKMDTRAVFIRQSSPEEHEWTFQRAEQAAPVVAVFWAEAGPGLIDRAGRCQVLDWKDGTIREEWNSALGNIMGAIYDEAHVTLLSEKGVLQSHRLPSGELSRVQYNFAGKPLALTKCPRSGLLVVLCGNGFLQAFDPEILEERWREPGSATRTCVEPVLSFPGVLAVGRDDGRIEFLSLTDGKVLHTTPPLGFSIVGLHALPDRALYINTKNKETIRWNLEGINTQ